VVARAPNTVAKLRDFQMAEGDCKPSSGVNISEDGFQRAGHGGRILYGSSGTA